MYKVVDTMASVDMFDQLREEFKKAFDNLKLTKTGNPVEINLYYDNKYKEYRVKIDFTAYKVKEDI